MKTDYKQIIVIKRRPSTSLRRLSRISSRLSKMWRAKTRRRAACWHSSIRRGKRLPQNSRTGTQRTRSFRRKSTFSKVTFYGNGGTNIVEMLNAIWQRYAQFFLSILLNFFPGKNLVPPGQNQVPLEKNLVKNARVFFGKQLWSCILPYLHEQLYVLTKHRVIPGEIQEDQGDHGQEAHYYCWQHV